jgi:hypothetical protein
MAVTLLSEHRFVEQGRNVAGEPIMNDSAQDDLGDLVQAQHVNFAANVGNPLAQGGTNFGIDEAGVVAFTNRFRGQVRLWSDAGRFVFHGWGQDVRWQISIGGQTFLATATGTLQWYSSSTAVLSGITVDGNGFAEVIVQAQERTNVGTREWFRWTLEQLPMQVSELPDSDHADTDFQRLDTEADDPDRPVDGWLGQTLVRNGIEALKARPRGTAIMWPVTTTPTRQPRFSTLREKCFGPFVHMASPWAESLQISVYGIATNGDVDFFPCVEGESREAALGRSQTFASGVLSHKTYTGIPVKRGPTHARNIAWLGMRSEIGGLVSTGHSFSQRAISGQLQTSTKPANGQPTRGRCIVFNASNAVQDNLAAKPSFPDGNPEFAIDIAASENDTAGVEDNNLWLTPVEEVRKILELSGSMSWRLYGVADLRVYSVWIGEDIDLDEADPVKVFPVNRLPAASGIAKARRLTNEATQWGSPMIATHHEGQRWNDDTDGINNFRGVWRFASADTGYRDVGVWQIPRSANPSSPSGLAALIQKVYAQAMAVMIRTDDRNLDLPQVDVNWRLSTSTNPHEDLTDTYTVATGPVEPSKMPSYSVNAATVEGTLYDIYGAAIVQSRDASGDYSHAWNQQLTRLDDALRGNAWDLAPVLSMDIPAAAATPIYLKLQAQFNPSVGRWWLVSPSGWAWYGPRR